MTHTRHPAQSLASLFTTSWVTTHRALCWLGVVVALTLGAFGGSPLPGRGLGVLLGGMVLLVIASTFTPMFATLGRHPYPLGEGVWVGLVMAWGIAAIVLSWLGQRGLRNLRRRPHPFLVD